MTRAVALAVGATILSACVSVDVEPRVRFADACPTGLQTRQIAELYFGRNIGGAFGVSDADWQAFVDEEITPRFPDGLSVSDVAGQWRGPNGQIVREPSKSVMLVLNGQADEPERLDAIRTAYVSRFRQDAVMLIERSACVGF